MSVTVTADVLGNLASFIDSVPDRARLAARLAINTVANRTGKQKIEAAIYKEIAFPAGYLDAPDRLGVAKNATEADLTAIIRARQRATSLARFLTPGQSISSSRTSGVKVQVKPGQTVDMKNAFLVRLRQGAALTETQNNLGLAVRLKPGENIRNRYDGNPPEIFPNVYLLYGPSVDQVFRNVADDLSDGIADDVEKEFTRQFNRIISE